MVCLAQYAKTCGADGILFTCSAFGPAIDEVKRTIGLPTLKPNEAMFSDALHKPVLTSPASAVRQLKATLGFI
jgi:maleate cis-trans isomerase